MKRKQNGRKSLYPYAQWPMKQLKGKEMNLLKKKKKAQKVSKMADWDTERLGPSRAVALWEFHPP